MIDNGENSKVEFKQDIDQHNQHKLVKVLVGFLNSEGGTIILGVTDGGQVSGIALEKLEQKIINVSQDLIVPSVDPNYKEFKNNRYGKSIATVTVERGKTVHAFVESKRKEYLVRVGTHTHELNIDALGRLFQERKAVHAERQIIPGTSIMDLDLRRVSNYFLDLRNPTMPTKEEINQILHARSVPVNPEYQNRQVPAEQSELQELLTNTKFMTDEGVTMAGILLFGSDPTNYLSNAKIDATEYSGTDKENEKRRKIISGAMTPLLGNGRVVKELGLVEKSVNFVTGVTNKYPEEIVREAIVNALVHRDYMFLGTNIELSLYCDRLEFISPGRLFDGVTIESMTKGDRATRNQLLQEVMKDYWYLQHNGKGVPKKIIEGMKIHNCTEPQFVEEERKLILRLLAGQQTQF